MNGAIDSFVLEKGLSFPSSSQSVLRLEPVQKGYTAPQASPAKGSSLEKSASVSHCQPAAIAAGSWMHLHSKQDPG